MYYIIQEFFADRGKREAFLSLERFMFEILQTAALHVGYMYVQEFKGFILPQKLVSFYSSGPE